MVYQTRELSRRRARERWRKREKWKKRGVNSAVYTKTHIHTSERGKLMENSPYVLPAPDLSLSLFDHKCLCRHFFKGRAMQTLMEGTGNKTQFTHLLHEVSSSLYVTIVFLLQFLSFSWAICQWYSQKNIHLVFFFMRAHVKVPMCVYVDISMKHCASTTPEII